ncbi:MAG: CbtA family protein [Candidatus Nitrosotenuis sp.]
MKAYLFILIVLFSGFSAGIVYGFINFVTTEPFLDSAIELENRAKFQAGEEKDTPEFRAEYDAYRYWQKSGMVLAGGIYGLATGSLFGIVYAYSRKALSGKHEVQKALVLAGLMWFTVFMIPFLKYPANPPTVGDPNTVIYRAILYLSFIAISGLGALAFYQVYKKASKNKKILAFAGYAIFISIAFVLMPQNPDKISAPMDLVNGFRAMSATGVTIYWIINAVILGALWQRFQARHELQKELQ